LYVLAIAPNKPCLSQAEAFVLERRFVAIVEQRRALDLEAAAVLAELRDRAGLQ